MRHSLRLPSSTLQRATTYFAIFTVGVVAAEAVSYLSIRDYPLVLLPRLIILITLPVIGGIFIGERHLLSRIISASVLFALGVVALQFDEFPSYQLLLALIICCLGAQTFLHRRPKTTFRAIVYSLTAIAIALLFFIAVAAVMSMLNHFLIYSHYPS